MILLSSKFHVVGVNCQQDLNIEQVNFNLFIFVKARVYHIQSTIEIFLKVRLTQYMNISLIAPGKTFSS